MRKQIVAVTLFLVLPFCFLIASPSAPFAGAPDFDKLVDEYFDFQFQYHPTAGTAAGFHKYDTQLEDPSRASLDAEAAGLKKLLAKFAAVDKSKLPEVAQGDLAVIQSDANARLLELQDIRMWEKDPDNYSSGP